MFSWARPTTGHVGPPTVVRRTTSVTRSMFIAACGLLVASCGQDGYESLASTRACDPAAETFALEIDNPFFPLPVGQQVVLEGEEGGQHLLVRITALDEIEIVAGVRTRVVEEYEAKGGRVVEVSRNYFAQARDGTVCYFGEDVDMYDGAGNITSHSGTWRAGVDANQPGIFMLPSLQVGVAFQQEIAPGVAEDQAKVIALGDRTEVPAGTFETTATLRDGVRWMAVQGRRSTRAGSDSSWTDLLG